MVDDEEEASDDDDVDAAALEEETRASTNPNIGNDGQNTEDDEMDELEASPVASVQAIPVASGQATPVQATTSRLLITTAKRTRTADPPKKEEGQEAPKINKEHMYYHIKIIRKYHKKIKHKFFLLFMGINMCSPDENLVSTN